jgi:hypothetical protein
MSDALTVRELLRRIPEGVSIVRVAVLAELNPDHIRQIVKGKRKGSPASVAKIKLALARLRARATDGPSVEFCLYQALLARAAQALSVSIAEVRASDPADKGRTPAARMCAQVRWLAFYLMNVGFGVAGAQVARAAGVSKNAVSLALKEVELRRETDNDFADLLDQLELELMG